MVHWRISRISHCFGVNRHFILAGYCPFRPIVGICFRVNTPTFQSYTFLIPKRVFLAPDRVFWAIVRECSRSIVHGYGGCSFVEEYKNKKKQKSHSTCLCFPLVASRPLIGSEPNLTGLVNSLTLSPTPIVKSIKINCDFGEGLKFHVLALLRRTPLTRLSPAGFPVIDTADWPNGLIRRNSSGAVPPYKLLGIQITR